MQVKFKNKYNLWENNEYLKDIESGAFVLWVNGKRFYKLFINWRWIAVDKCRKFYGLEGFLFVGAEAGGEI